LLQRHNIRGRELGRQFHFHNVRLQPLRWIAENAGYDGYVVAAKVAEQPTGHGFNAKTGEYEDLFQAGVIDPVKVTRSALQNASSIAALVLTTETLVVNKPEEDDEDE
ncbi:MAG: TCP-1/cpn60 chaperonin family protein, partial [Rothia aeria]